MGFDYQSVPGDYQYRALTSRHRMQAFWHFGKLFMIDRIIRRSLAHEPTILEIGSGSGNLLLQTIIPGTFPIALDISFASLAFVRDRLHALGRGPDGLRNSLCTQAVGQQLPLASGSLDWVLLSEVIEHLVEPGAVVREAKRVLRPGGFLLVTTPNYRSLWPVLEWGIDRFDLAPKMAGEQHIAQFHAVLLRQLLEDAGLEIRRLGSIYFLSPFISLVSSRLAHRQLERELQTLTSLGMLLVSVSQKP